MILVTFNNRVSVSFFEGDCWHSKRVIYLLPGSWAFEPDWSLSTLGVDWLIVVLTRGRISGLMGVHRTNSSKETFKRAEHSIAAELCISFAFSKWYTSSSFNEFNWPQKGVTWHRLELLLMVSTLLLWMVFSLCGLVFIAEPQASMAYCGWEYTRLK